MCIRDRVPTISGQSIKLVGSLPQLGNWNPANAVALSAGQQTAANTLWSTTVTLPAGTTFEYKFVNVTSSGWVVWEADPNHSYTVPSTCAKTVTVGSKFQNW